MTSADVPQMELERTIELSAPIVGLGIDVEDPDNPMLVVAFEGRTTEPVRVDAGDRYSRRQRSALQSLQLGDLLVRADGKDVVVHREDDEVVRLTGHSTRVTSLASYPIIGAPLLVSGSEGGSARIWNPRTGELLRQSRPSRVSVLLTYLGPEGRPRIASGGRTGRLRLWNPRLPVPPLTSLVSTRGFSDRVAREDLLARGALVEALRDLLKPGDEDAPTVITVEGAWGSGKSTLLELVKNRLSTEPAEVPPGRRFTVFAADRALWRHRVKPPSPTKIKPLARPLVVSFNPWRHQSSEQVWAGLAKAVTEAAEATILPHQNTRERYWFTRNAERVDRRHLQRRLWRRTLSPFLSLAGLSFAGVGAERPDQPEARLGVVGDGRSGRRRSAAHGLEVPVRRAGREQRFRRRHNGSVDPRPVLQRPRRLPLPRAARRRGLGERSRGTPLRTDPADRRPRPLHAQDDGAGVRGDQRVPVRRLPRHEVRAGPGHHRRRGACGQRLQGAGRREDRDASR